MLRVNISIPEELLKPLDEQCKELGYTRSEYLRELIRKGINEQILPSDIPQIKKNIEMTPDASLGKLPEGVYKMCKHGSQKGLCKFGCK